ncbi:MAG TPA: sulfite exporter TauE/SafE family protein [Acidimicrobiales bacterium]|nr:sulfite exporter TauE/SafE family protein [Acidimicrobiales bacterium]
MTAPWPVVSGIGLLIGVLSGLFGVGGSSLATPALALLGVPGVTAVATPLPATVPIAAAASWAYVTRGELNRRVALWSAVGGVPATIAGALLSRAVGGQALLVASGVVLAVVGLRVLRPLSEEEARAGAGRRRRPVVVVGSVAVAGLATGLLANGGGFLLVPLYLLVLGLPMQTASGTSLVVVAALSVPTLVTHWVLGHIDWAVATALAAGAVPGAVLGSRLAGRVSGAGLQRAFGWLLIAFAVFFVVWQVAAG